jgi:dihydroorotase
MGKEAQRSMPEILLKGGTVVDPPPRPPSGGAVSSYGDHSVLSETEGRLEDADLLIRDGRVVRRGKGLSSRTAKVVDVSGAFIFPAFVDLHTHIREPGARGSEDMESACKAAVLGGYGAVVAMPNTEPPIDSREAARAFLGRARSLGLCHVEVAGCITERRRGARLAPLATMAHEGVRIFTDDGAYLLDSFLMRSALKWARALGVVIADHPEESFLVTEGTGYRGFGGLGSRVTAVFGRSGGDESPAVGSERDWGSGVANEGSLSGRLGLGGRPKEAEEVAVSRDLVLCRSTGGRLHLMHLSVAESVGLVRRAKEAGAPVSCEVTPHHLCFTEDVLVNLDPVYKVNPPLRTKADTEALVEGLADGTIDAIATDHAPHAPELKELPFAEAPPGIAGLEVAASICYEVLVASGALGPIRFSEVMSAAPAAIAGLDTSLGFGLPLLEGSPAHITVFDPSRLWQFDPQVAATKAKLSPYAGRKLSGKVTHTFVGGVHLVEEGELV